MKKLTWLSLLLTAAALVLMCLPIGMTYQPLFSSYLPVGHAYVSPVIWEAGNRFPLLAAVMAAAALILKLICLLRRQPSPGLSAVALAFSCNGAVLALLALLPYWGMKTMTIAAVAIAALLLTAAVLPIAGRIWARHRQNRSKPGAPLAQHPGPIESSEGDLSH